MEITLDGHSGCIITVIKTDNKSFVRKKSPSIEYNKRLQAQYEKQSNYNMDTIFTTPTFDSGFDKEGLFYFDMAYLNGTTLAKAISTISLEKINDLATKLVGSCRKNVKRDPHAPEIFLKKTRSVVNNILAMDEFISKKWVSDISLIKKAEKFLINYTWSYVTHSPCHGDYTLENLIITPDNNIFAIDFLDSFYDSWQIDIAKLLQDLELGWSYRFSKIDENLAIRLLILKKNILRTILEMNEGENMVSSIYHILLLNILRIVPYTHDEFTMDYLLSKIKYLLNKLM